MRRILFSFVIIALGAFSLIAQEKMSAPTLNFLQRFQSTAPAHRASLKSVYAIQEQENTIWASAYLHLVDENDLTGLEENNVTINAQFGTILSVKIPVDRLQAVAQLPSVQYLEIGQRVYPRMSRVRTDEHSNIDKLHQGTDLAQAYTGKDVVVGIIDCGFQYNHINFYDTEGKSLRIKRVWDQNNDNGNAPSGYYYGTEYTTSNEIVNAKYDYGSETHATHVAGIAAGAYKGVDYYGAAPDADLIFVSYNQNDYSSSNTSISDGIKYIYDYAESQGKPCVINMSLGTHFGPHDGTSTFDRICDQLQGEGKLLVGAAGNEGYYYIHTSKTFTNTDKSLKALLEFDGSSNYTPKETWIDIWGDVDKPISVRFFTYNKSGKKEYSTTDFYSTSNSNSYTPSISGASGTLEIATNTDPFNKKGNVSIYCKLYTNYDLGIEIKGESGSTVHAWIDDYYSNFAQTNISGFTSGDSHYTSGEIGGTGKRIISVGAYSSCTKVKHKYSSYYNESGETLNDLASFSSLGPTADNRMKPDITAPGTMVVSSYNANACKSQQSDYYQMITDVITQNSTKYYWGSMQGTSMATPVVTGVLATWLQANPKLTPEQVRDAFKVTAKTDSYTGSISGTGDNQWGYGKINAYDGLVYCLELANVESVTGAPTLPLIYPNPASDYCYIVLPADDKQIKVSIIAPNGSVVYAQTFDSLSAGKQVELNLKNIVSGLYLVQIVGEQTKQTTKLMVK